jgi:hypothetical protein
LVQYGPIDRNIAAASDCGEGLFEFGSNENHVTIGLAT